MPFKFKSLSILLASAFLITSMSNSVLAAGEDEDGNKSCCPNVIRTMVNYAKGEALKVARVRAKEKVFQDITSPVSQLFISTVATIGIDNIKAITDTCIDEATGYPFRTIVEPVNPKKYSILIPFNMRDRGMPIAKVTFKDYLDTKAKTAIKLHVDQALENYGSVGIGRVEVALGLGVTCLTYVCGGGSYSLIPVLVTASDAIINSPIVKWLTGYDHILHSDKSTLEKGIDSYDTNSALRAFKLEVTESDRRYAASRPDILNEMERPGLLKRSLGAVGAICDIIENIGALFGSYSKDNENDTK